MKIRINVNQDCCIKKETVKIARRDKCEIIVDDGAKAVIVCKETGVERYFEPVNMSYTNIFDTFDDGKQIRKGLFGRKPREELTLEVYSANSSLRENWGIGNISYTEDDSTSSLVGCHGTMKIEITNLKEAYKRLSLAGLIENSNDVGTFPFWEHVHGEFDEIIRNQLINYYRNSRDRDGSDFEPYRQNIINAFNASFSAEGINIIGFTVENLICPTRNEANQEDCSTCEDKEQKDEVFDLNDSAISAQDKPKMVTCENCGASIDNQNVYCPRCGHKI